MLEVWLVVDGEVNAAGELVAASPATATKVIFKACQNVELFWYLILSQPLVISE